MQVDRILIITRPTRLQESVKRYNTKSQAKFFVESRGQRFDDIESEDETYERAMDTVAHSIPRDIKFSFVERTFLPNYVFGPNDLILTLGQDGLVVNAAKYLEGQRVLAVNPDPERYDGILLPFHIGDVPHAIESLLNDKLQERSITMAEASLNDGQKLLAFNDLFIGPKSHTSLRYQITYQEQSERQMSSGILVSTPAGSTGWMSSVFNMARGIQSFQTQQTTVQPERRQWEEKKLLFVVREPFESKWSDVNIVAGELLNRDKLILESYMAEGGVIFSDGIESDFLDFNAGARLEVGISNKITHLLVPQDQAVVSGMPGATTQQTISRTPSKSNTTKGMRPESKRKRG